MQLIQSTIGAIDTVNSLREGDDWMVIVSHSSLTSRGSVEVQIWRLCSLYVRCIRRRDRGLKEPEKPFLTVMDDSIESEG